jgi:hypothetical protein
MRVASLSRDHFGLLSPLTTSLPGAAAAVADGRAIALVSNPTTTVVGGVLLWAQQAAVLLEAVIVDAEAGRVDEWLEGFDPRPAVFGLDGNLLVDPVPPADRREGRAPAVPPAFDLADVEVVIENGVVRAEVDGLEVARLVVHEDGEHRVEVGVGQYDRAGHKVMSADRPLDETLDDVVTAVRASRHRSAPAHTYNRLCRERWLRSVLVAEPSLVGLVELHPVDPIPTRSGLLDVSPAPAIGADPEGVRVLVMASSGVDPGLALSTSAVARREDPARIVVALPPRDLIAPTQRLLDILRWPVETAGVEPPWM